MDLKMKSMAKWKYGEDEMKRGSRGLKEVWPTSKKIQAKH